MKQHITLNVGDKAYLIFKAKRLGHNENTVLLCKVTRIVITDKGVTYDLIPIKAVTGSKQIIGNYISCFWACEEDINKGTSNNVYTYPIFTDKGKCIQWLKGGQHE